MAGSSQYLSVDWRTAAEVLPIKDHRRIPIHKWAMLLALGDLCGIVLVAGIALDGFANPGRQAWAAVAGCALLWSLAASTQRLYRRPALLSSLRSQLRHSAIAAALAFGLMLLLMFNLGVIQFHSFWLASCSAAALAWMWTLRVMWHRHLRVLLRRGRCLDRALMLVGQPRLAAALSHSVEYDTRGEVRVVATAQIPGRPGGPSSDWVENAIRMGRVDRVFVAAFDTALAETNALLARLARLAVDVTLLPNLEGIETPVLRVDQIGPRPVLDVNQVPLTATWAFAKRVEDLVMASLALVALMPVLVLIAIAIKIDSPGPIFFRQWRAGFHDHRFRMWKFRTMYHNMRDEGSERQTSRGDRRVTRVGRLLRRTSLDEVPQLLNVLAGDMSIVGPRPHALSMTATGKPLHEVVVDYSSRHRVRPGITGWAQVSGCRGEVETREKLQRRVLLDCFYIEHWSLRFDLWIVLRTAVGLLFDRSAY